MDWIKNLGEATVNPGTPMGKSVIMAPGCATSEPAARHSTHRLFGGQRR